MAFLIENDTPCTPRHSVKLAACSKVLSFEASPVDCADVNKKDSTADFNLTSIAVNLGPDRAPMRRRMHCFRSSAGSPFKCRSNRQSYLWLSYTLYNRTVTVEARDSIQSAEDE